MSAGPDLRRPTAPSIITVDCPQQTALRTQGPEGWTRRAAPSCRLGSTTSGCAGESTRPCCSRASRLWFGAPATTPDQYAGPRHSHGLRILGPGRRLRNQSPPHQYTGLSTYGRAFWVGLLNTLLIAVICIPLATLLGFAIGVARLSPNWLLSRLALIYTSVLRNTPLLLLLLFWYNAVLKSLPGPRQSISLGDVVFLNNRGLFLPMPVPRDQAVWFTRRNRDWRWSSLSAFANGRAGARSALARKRRCALVAVGADRWPACARDRRRPGRRSRSISRSCPASI